MGVNLLTYRAPESLDEAVALLQGTPGAKILAGGHSLLLEPGRSRAAATALIDLRKIPDLAGVKRQRNGLYIGAMTTYTVIASDATIRAAYTALAEAASSIGDFQERNRATLGGNIAEGDSTSDLLAVAITFAATITVFGSKGPRAIAADTFVGSSSQTALAPGEIITAVTFPARATRSGSAYEKFRNPANTLAVCAVAASLTLTSDGSVSACRVALAGAATQVARLVAVETALAGRKPTPETLAMAAEQAAEGLQFRADHFASAEYRAHLTHVVAGRALARALERVTSK